MSRCECGHYAPSMKSNPYSLTLAIIGVAGLVLSLVVTLLTQGHPLNPFSAFAGWIGTIGAISFIAMLVFEGWAWQERAKAKQAAPADSPSQP